MRGKPAGRQLLLLRVRDASVWLRDHAQQSQPYGLSSDDPKRGRPGGVNSAGGNASFELTHFDEIYISASHHVGSERRMLSNSDYRM